MARRDTTLRFAIVLPRDCSLIRILFSLESSPNLVVSWNKSRVYVCTNPARCGQKGERQKNRVKSTLSRVVHRKKQRILLLIFIINTFKNCFNKQKLLYLPHAVGYFLNILGFPWYVLIIVVLLKKYIKPVRVVTFVEWIHLWWEAAKFASKFKYSVKLIRDYLSHIQMDTTVSLLRVKCLWMVPPFSLFCKLLII